MAEKKREVVDTIDYSDENRGKGKTLTRKKARNNEGKRNTEVQNSSSDSLVRVVMHRSMQDGAAIYHTGLTFSIRKDLADRWKREGVAYLEGEDPPVEKQNLSPNPMKDYSQAKPTEPCTLETTREKVYPGDQCNQVGYSSRRADKAGSHKCY